MLLDNSLKVTKFILSCISSVLKSRSFCVSQHLHTSQPHLELSQSRKETQQRCSVMWMETNQLMWCGCREGNWNSLQHPTTGDDICHLLLSDITHNAMCTLRQGVALCDMWGSDSCVTTDWSRLECYAMSTVIFGVKLSETRCCTRREVKMTGINTQWQWWCNGELAGRFVTETGGWWDEVWNAELFGDRAVVWNNVLFINIVTWQSSVINVKLSLSTTWSHIGTAEI